MTKRAMEMAILGLLLETEPGFDLLAFDPSEALSTTAGELGADGALAQMVTEADPFDRVDHVWLAYSLVLGVRLADPALEGPLHDAGKALLSPWALSDPDAAADGVVGAIERMLVGQPLPTEVLDRLETAFEGNLVRSGGVTDPQITLSGTMSDLATLLIELGTNDLSCRASVHDVDVDGEAKPAIFVEVDTCTNKPFTEVRKAIDPRRWPDANPFFRSVTVKGTPTTSATGNDWAGVIQEEVGPGLNGSVYTTDLSITYLERPAMAITSFDLAPQRNDDGRVTVDRGFVSATDEGIHRRVRTLKVYRIEDLATPLSWVCPLWSQQVVLAGWWSA